MKRVIGFVMLALVWFMSYAYAVSAAEIDKVSTFQGVKLGDVVSRYKTLQRIENMKSPYGDLDFYQPTPKDGEDYVTIGDVEGVSVVYAVYKGKIVSARAVTEGVVDARAFHTLLVNRFGEPSQGDLNLDDLDNLYEERGCIWYGKNLNVVLLCAKDEYGKVTTSMLYIWMPLSNMMEAERGKAVKVKAVKDLD